MDNNTTHNKSQQFSAYTDPKLNSHLQQMIHNPDRDCNSTKNTESWKTFTYFSPLEHKITRLFKQTEVKMTFKLPTTHIILQNQN